MPITIRTLRRTDFTACSSINRSLPDWFGLEEGLEEAEGYLREHDGLVAEDGDEIVGYLTYELLFPESAEISWMAVSGAHHRRGIGRLLIAELERRLVQQQVALLSVKTLADSHPSPEYAITRGFYAAMGFRPQMVFPDLWDPSNPCLLMVKSIGQPKNERTR